MTFASRGPFGMPIRCSVVLCFAILTLSFGAADAQEPPRPTDHSIAQGLFEEALGLMEQGNAAEACPKLAESHRLDPGSGTILNLAICLERVGKTASAYVAYDEALARAVRDGNREREATARERLAHLRPLVSKVVVRVHPGTASLERLDIQVDGASVRSEAWGIRVPVDPGVHTISAAALNRVGVRREVTIDEPGKVYEVEIPALALAPVPVPAVTATRSVDAHSTTNRRSLLGYVMLSAGGVLLVGGGISGVLAVDRHAESDRECPGARDSCSAAGVRAEESATRFSWGANIGIGLGLVAAGVGTYLLLTAPRAPARSLASGYVMRF